MSAYDEIQVSEWLREGIAAAKAGRRAEARELLMRVIEVSERSERAWLWLSGVVDTDEDRLICLENVLTLNPDNVQARAGLKWLQARGLGITSLAVGEPAGEERAESGEPSTAADDAFQPGVSQEPDAFMAPEGCAYCGHTVDKGVARCVHCGGRLTTKEFKKRERSPTAYFLQPIWTVLAATDLVGFFLIGFAWDHVDMVPSFLKPYLLYFVGSAVADPASRGTVIEPDLSLQIVRFTFLALAVSSGLVALGLFLRVAQVHPLGLALIALHLAIDLALFAFGFLGYLAVAFRVAFTILVTRFMLLTVEDFGREERRERLEPDRHLLNDVDYYTRGRVYEKRGMWAKALLHWQRAAIINPQRDTYFAAMARAYARLGRYEMALAQMDEALRVSRAPEEWQPLREVIVEAGRSAAAEPVATDKG